MTVAIADRDKGAGLLVVQAWLSRRVRIDLRFEGHRGRHKSARSFPSKMEEIEVERVAGIEPA